MAELLRIKNIDINPKEMKAYAREYVGRIEFYGNIGSYPGYEGLHWRTWKFVGIDASEKDGALITLDSGRRTPVEFVSANKIFSEVPLEGELVFLHIDRDGEVSAYHFDSTKEKDNSFLFEVGQGEIFCWVALGDRPSEILEYEEPGFTDLDLKLVDFGAKSISGQEIPDQFWQMIKQLEKGGTENSVIPIVELSEI